MNFKKITKKIKILIICINAVILNSCNNVVLMHPKGQIGMEEYKLILTALGMMLTIVIPVIIMTIFFAIKYNASNNNKQYQPNWCYSNKIEIAIWSIPIIIIIILATITWQSTQKLDPSKSIKSNKQPILIEVIALDWKWLFIYPKYNIAVINKVVFPNNTPIKFSITSNSVMNSFFIPQLGGQIYAMAGMHSTLNLISNIPGTYKGISSNFSGAGFSTMKFIAIATENEEKFYQWIQNVKKSNKQINSIFDYEELALPTIDHPITYFSYVKPNLFYNIINKFM